MQNTRNKIRELKEMSLEQARIFYGKSKSFGKVILTFNAKVERYEIQDKKDRKMIFNGTYNECLQYINN